METQSSLRRRAARSGSNIIDSPSARNGSSTRSTSRQRGSRTYGSDDEKADTHSMVTALTADHHRVSVQNAVMTHCRTRTARGNQAAVRLVSRPGAPTGAIAEPKCLVLVGTPRSIGLAGNSPGSDLHRFG
jgi:hypothetical protein